MTYVIAEPCVDVMDTACVSVCPVDCIHYDEGVDRKLYIDPNECIDCGGKNRCKSRENSIDDDAYRAAARTAASGAGQST